MFNSGWPRTTIILINYKLTLSPWFNYLFDKLTLRKWNKNRNEPKKKWTQTQKKLRREEVFINLVLYVTLQSFWSTSKPKLTSNLALRLFPKNKIKHCKLSRLEDKKFANKLLHHIFNFSLHDCDTSFSFRRKIQVVQNSTIEALLGSSSKSKNLSFHHS